MEIYHSKIPYEYFVTTGEGSSNYGPKGDPFEAGSYDAALNEAKIDLIDSSKRVFELLSIGGNILYGTI